MSARKILVVDDSPDNRAIMRVTLIHAGFEVREAADGAEGVEAAVRERPDLILLDMAMPVMSGWEAARRLKELESTRAIPIFAFTASAQPDDERKAREAGCDGFVPKPCVPRDVAAKIRAQVGH